MTICLKKLKTLNNKSRNTESSQQHPKEKSASRKPWSLTWNFYQSLTSTLQCYGSPSTSKFTISGRTGALDAVWLTTVKSWGSNPAQSPRGACPPTLLCVLPASKTRPSCSLIGSVCLGSGVMFSSNEVIIIFPLSSSPLILMLIFAESVPS